MLSWLKDQVLPATFIILVAYAIYSAITLARWYGYNEAIVDSIRVGLCILS